MARKNSKVLILEFLLSKKEGAIWGELLDYLRSHDVTSKATLKKALDSLMKDELVQKDGRRYVLTKLGLGGCMGLIPILEEEVLPERPSTTRSGVWRIEGEMNEAKLKKLNEAVKEERKKTGLWLPLGTLKLPPQLEEDFGDEPIAGYSFIVPSIDFPIVDIAVVGRMIGVWSTPEPSLESLKEKSLPEEMSEDNLRKALEGIPMIIFTRFKEILKKATGLEIKPIVFPHSSELFTYSKYIR